MSVTSEIEVIKGVIKAFRCVMRLVAFHLDLFVSSLESKALQVSAANHIEVKVSFLE